MPLAFNSIDVVTFFEWQAKGKEFLLLDVRDKEAFEKGHVPGAIHLPLMEFSRSLSNLPRDKLLILICYSGSSSKIACQFLIDFGYEPRQIYNFDGGYNAWQNHQD